MRIKLLKDQLRAVFPRRGEKYFRTEMACLFLLGLALCFFILPYFTGLPTFIRRLPARTGLFLNVSPFVQAREQVKGHARTRLSCSAPDGQKQFEFNADLYSKIAGPHRRKMYYIAAFSLVGGRPILAVLPRVLKLGFCSGGEWGFAAGCPSDTQTVELFNQDLEGEERWKTQIRCQRE